MKSRPSCRPPRCSRALDDQQKSKSRKRFSDTFHIAFLKRHPLQEGVSFQNIFERQGVDIVGELPAFTPAFLFPDALGSFRSDHLNAEFGEHRGDPFGPDAEAESPASRAGEITVDGAVDNKHPFPQLPLEIDRIGQIQLGGDLGKLRVEKIMGRACREGHERLIGRTLI